MLVKSEINRLKQVKEYIRNPYAWPGGYPKVLITVNGGCLCYNCARDEWTLICAESFDNTSCGFRIAGVDVNWENSNLYCGHCDARIESAYGES